MNDQTPEPLSYEGCLTEKLASGVYRLDGRVKWKGVTQYKNLFLFSFFVENLEQKLTSSFRINQKVLIEHARLLVPEEIAYRPYRKNDFVEYPAWSVVAKILSFPPRKKCPWCAIVLTEDSTLHVIDDDKNSVEPSDEMRLEQSCEKKSVLHKDPGGISLAGLFIDLRNTGLVVDELDVLLVHDLLIKHNLAFDKADMLAYFQRRDKVAKDEAIKRFFVDTTGCFNYYLPVKQLLYVVRRMVSKKHHRPLHQPVGSDACLSKVRIGKHEICDYLRQLWAVQSLNMKLVLLVHLRKHSLTKRFSVIDSTGSLPVSFTSRWTHFLVCSSVESEMIFRVLDKPTWYIEGSLKQHGKTEARRRKHEACGIPGTTSDLDFELVFSSENADDFTQTFIKTGHTVASTPVQCKRATLMEIKKRCFTRNTRLTVTAVVESFDKLTVLKSDSQGFTFHLTCYLADGTQRAHASIDDFRIIRFILPVTLSWKTLVASFQEKQESKWTFSLDTLPSDLRTFAWAVRQPEDTNVHHSSGTGAKTLPNPHTCFSIIVENVEHSDCLAEIRDLLP